jgi:hypothetical protein
MTIEENIGNGQFRTVLTDEWCAGPKSKAEWPLWEGGEYGCWAGGGFMFGDFNKDGLVDIVVNGNKHHNDKRITDGTVYLSTGKFKYDIVHPTDDDYPLVDVVVSVTSLVAPSAEDTTAKAIAKRKAEVAAAKAKRIAEEATQAAEEELIEKELAELEAELLEENKSSPLFDGRYSFTLSRYNENEGSQRLGNGYIEINNGIMTVAKDGRTLDTGSIDLYDSFEGQINKKGNIMSSLKIPVLFGVDSTPSVDLNGSIDSPLQGKWDHYFDVILKLRKKE